ncbi:MAG TPA: PH domain-containing protein [Candidatus Limnocylindria bacterium]|nr:PH domain-containing protein [Candidatus Limnocylindria bacterium]
MGYPAKLLAEGERIDFEMRPHWKSMIWPSCVLVGTLVVGGWLLGKAPDGSTGTAWTWVVVIVGLVLILGWFVRPLVTWLTTQYVFTDRRIITRTGIVARRGRDMPLSKVNDVSFHYSVIERIVSCGTLVVSSASDENLVIASVPHVEDIQREIYRLREHEEERRRGRGGPLPDSGVADD